MKKGLKFDVILWVMLAVVFALWAITLLNQSKILEQHFEEEIPESIEIDTSKIKVITETPSTTAETHTETTESPLTEELHTETEKPIETAYFESQSVDNWSVSETTAETTVETEAVAENDNGYLGSFRITGYYPEEGFYEGKICASGVGLHKGVCAMNDSQRKALGITYGTQIYIDGLGTFTVADCGCKYGKVDIWCYTKSEAYALPKYANVYIVR